MKITITGVSGCENQIDLEDLEPEENSLSYDKDLVSTMTLKEKAVYSGLLVAQEMAAETASSSGWYKDAKTGEPIQRNFGEVIALMHSELSEALEADRKGLMDDKLPHRDGREVEFADCILRILDTAAALGLDVAGALIEKNRFNQTREDHKIENRDKKRY